MDGLNIARSKGFVDSEYERGGPEREAFERLRREDHVHNKPALAMALIHAIDHCLRASTAEVQYRPMAFLPEWARDGGRSGAMAAFAATRLDRYADYITLTPSRRDDDEPAIRFANNIKKQGGECYLLTNDNFINHKEKGMISAEWFEETVVSYMWVGRTNALLINLPHTVSLPGLA